jgi:hypothetical protein
MKVEPRPASNFAEFAEALGINTDHAIASMPAYAFTYSDPNVPVEEDMPNDTEILTAMFIRDHEGILKCLGTVGRGTLGEWVESIRKALP